VYPALAVARALRDAQPELELAYVGGVRGLERRIVTAQAEPSERWIANARHDLGQLARALGRADSAAFVAGR